MNSEIEALQRQLEKARRDARVADKAWAETKNLSHFHARSRAELEYSNLKRELNRLERLHG